MIIPILLPIILGIILSFLAYCDLEFKFENDKERRFMVFILMFWYVLVPILLVWELIKWIKNKDFKRVLIFFKNWIIFLFGGPYRYDTK